MARARSTFGKLQRDQAKKDRARAKMDDRQSRREDKAADDLDGNHQGNGEVVDQTRLLEPFARLHEGLARRPNLPSRLRSTRGRAPAKNGGRVAPAARPPERSGRGLAPFQPAAET